MEDVKILRLDNVESCPLPGAGTEDAGWMKRIVHPLNNVDTHTFMGISEVNPGYSPHRWHSHTSDRAEGYEIVYPEGFVEVYHIVSGSGVVQWKTEDGHIKEEKVGAGDTIFFPPGVAEHQLYNNSSEKIVVIFCGGPIPVYR